MDNLPELDEVVVIGARPAPSSPGTSRYGDQRDPEQFVAAPRRRDPIEAFAPPLPQVLPEVIITAPRTVAPPPPIEVPWLPSLLSTVARVGGAITSLLIPMPSGGGDFRDQPITPRRPPRPPPSPPGGEVPFPDWDEIARPIDPNDPITPRQPVAPADDVVLDPITITAPRVLSPIGDPFAIPATQPRRRPRTAPRPSARPRPEPQGAGDPRVGDAPLRDARQVFDPTGVPYDLPTGSPSLDLRTDAGADPDDRTVRDFEPYPPRSGDSGPETGPVAVEPLIDPVAQPLFAQPPTSDDVDQCQCEKPKKRKPRQPRVVCYRGTYRQTRSGVNYSPIEEVPCDAPVSKRETRAPTKRKRRKRQTLGDLAKDVFGIPVN